MSHEAPFRAKINEKLMRPCKPTIHHLTLQYTTWHLRNKKNTRSQTYEKNDNILPINSHSQNREHEKIYISPQYINMLPTLFWTTHPLLLNLDNLTMKKKSNSNNPSTAVLQSQ